MLLIKTSGNKKIRFKDKNIFLGKWCLMDISEKILKNIDYKILPHPWKNLDKVTNDSNYILNTYKKTIPFLSLYLNNYHKVNYSNRYWEILVGPWLFFFIDFLYEKYLLINEVNNLYKNLETYTNHKIVVPYSMADFSFLSGQDEFNLLIFSKIIKDLKFPIREINENNITNFEIFSNIKNRKLNLYTNPKNLIKKYLLNIFSNNYKKIKYYFYKNKNDFFDLNIPITEKEKKDFFKKINNIYIKEYRNIRFLRKNINKIKLKISDRKKILNIDNLNKDNFVNLLSSTILNFLPIEYFEDYSLIKKHYENFLPKNTPKMVGIRSPFENNSAIRFLTSELSERNSTIISCQEGGGIGVRSFNQIDEEVNLIGCDKYLTWGWSPTNKKHYKFYCTKTFFIKKYNYNKNGNILFVGGSCRKYHQSILFGQIPTFNEQHINLNINLIKNLKKEAYQNLIYRFHNQHGYNETKKIKSEFNDLKISLREEKTYYYDLLYNSRLAICTSDYTSNLQPLMINHPVIWYWDPEYHKVRNSMKKYYEALFDAGILHYSYESCSKLINNIFENPMDWWMTNKVQKARSFFSENCCRISENVSSELANITNKILKEK